MWLQLLIQLVTNFIQLVTLLTGLPDVFLGATLLCIGISFPDTVVNVSLALQNYHMMAISAIFSGQMMNFLVGFSLSCILKSLHKPSSRLAIWSGKKKIETISLIFVFATSLTNLAFLWFRLRFNR